MACMLARRAGRTWTGWSRLLCQLSPLPRPQPRSAHHQKQWVSPGLSRQHASSRGCISRWCCYVMKVSNGTRHRTASCLTRSRSNVGCGGGAMGAHAGALPLSLQAPGGQHEVLQVACITCGKVAAYHGERQLRSGACVPLSIASKVSRSWEVAALRGTLCVTDNCCTAMKPKLSNLKCLCL